MPTYRVRFLVPVEVFVTIERDNEDDAMDDAWPSAAQRLDELAVETNGVSVHGSVDGIGAEDAEEIL